MENNKKETLKREIKQWARDLQSKSWLFDIWNRKYAMKDKEGNIIETPDERVTKLAMIPYERDNNIRVDLLFKDGLKYFIPGGSIISGIGNETHLSSLSNCMVVSSPYDSYGGIYHSEQEMVQGMKRRAGVGLDLSNIRGKGEPVLNSALTSTGVVSIMDRFSNACKEVAQDGRRGALLLSIDGYHKDVEDFIDAKLEQGKVSNANISIKLSDHFMEKSKDKRTREYKLLHKIAENAWAWAEPGILFWDTIINNSPRKGYVGYEPICTNPCGEIPLPAYDTCRIGHLNLYAFVVNPFTENAYFDHSKFEIYVEQAVRYMDTIVDIEIDKIGSILSKLKDDPEPIDIKMAEISFWRKCKDMAETGRAIGVGVTGLTDALAALNIDYVDPGIPDMFDTLRTCSYHTSIKLAKEKGSIDLIEEHGYNLYILREFDNDSIIVDGYKKHGIRNLTLNTIAPVGTGSLFLGVSSGIEPIFAINTKRKRRVFEDEEPDVINEDGSWKEIEIVHPPFLDYMKANGMGGKDITEKVIKESPFIESSELDPNVKIEAQGIIQSYIDNSISVTHNIKESTTVEEVMDMIRASWQCGCKGFTIYREGCKKNAILSKADSKAKIDNKFIRKEELPCKLYSLKAEGINWLSIVSYDSGRPVELFMLRNKGLINLKVDGIDGTLKKISSGNYDLDTEMFSIKDLTSYYKSKDEEIITRTITRILQSNVYSIKDVIRDLEKVDTGIQSIVSAIKRVLLKTPGLDIESTSTCVCGGKIIMKEGCEECVNCGLTKCN